jgi:hypothetical protein
MPSAQPPPRRLLQLSFLKQKTQVLPTLTPIGEPLSFLASVMLLVRLCRNQFSAAVSDWEPPLKMRKGHFSCVLSRRTSRRIGMLFENGQEIRKKALNTKYCIRMNSRLSCASKTSGCTEYQAKDPHSICLPRFWRLHASLAASFAERILNLAIFWQVLVSRWHSSFFASLNSFWKD